MPIFEGTEITKESTDPRPCELSALCGEALPVFWRLLHGERPHYSKE